jgi:hypothetical protein
MISHLLEYSMPKLSIVTAILLSMATRIQNRPYKLVYNQHNVNNLPGIAQF